MQTNTHARRRTSRLGAVQRRALVAVVVALVGVTWMVWVGFGTARDRRVSAGAGSTATVPEPPRVDIIDKDRALIDGQPDAVSASVVVGATLSGRLSGQQAALLADAAGDVLRMYNDGTVDGYLRWLESAGLEPPGGFVRRLETSRESVELHFGTLRGAPIDTDSVVVRPFSLEDNRDEQGDDATTPVTEATRPERVPQGASAAAALAIEIVMPIQIRAHGYAIEDDVGVLGKPLQANTRLGLVMLWNDREQRWVLIKTRIYDLPDGAVAVMPPL